MRDDVRISRRAGYFECGATVDDVLVLGVSATDTGDVGDKEPFDVWLKEDVDEDVGRVVKGDGNVQIDLVPAQQKKKRIRV